jgi:flagellar biosynthesis protein FlhA
MPHATVSILPRATHLLAPVVVIGVVLLMVLPMPPLLLDVLLTIDIGLAVVLLLTAFYVREPIQFSVFPSLLLVLTLFRLALNVAGTRLILLHGSEGIDAAGHVIMAFGQFVVGGNFIVGVVVFLVLIAIQYVVINHGAVRISEVTARFTLDAMPGKQMAIDADLNAGLIDEKEARERRSRVRREADFYGAMDGAIRFTQRDAIAALIITAINIVAGLAIGVFMHGQELWTAAATFTILTVGEGLVTAIPALLVSMSGALITTRAASERTSGRRWPASCSRSRAPSRCRRACSCLLGLVPGLPTVPFLVVGGLLGAWPTRTPTRRPRARRRGAAAAADPLEAAIAVDPLSVEVGYALISLVDERQGGTLLSRVRSIRKQIATDTGIVVPAVHIADNLQLGPRAYVIKVKGVEVARGELYADRLLAINPGTAAPRSTAYATREPAFGLPAWWIPVEHRDAAGAAGYTVVDPDDGALDAPVGDHPHVPARPARAPADQGHGRSRRAVGAEAGGGARAEAGDHRRDPARAAAAAARARAGARPGDDPRSHRRRGGVDEGRR